MDINNSLKSLMVEITDLKAENQELTKAVSAMGAMQFLIFRFLMQYDRKLASAVATGISRELDKSPPPNWQGAQHYKNYIQTLADIASNPEQRDEKGRPLWIHIVKD